MPGVVIFRFRRSNLSTRGLLLARSTTTFLRRSCFLRTKRSFSSATTSSEESTTISLDDGTSTLSTTSTTLSSLSRGSKVTLLFENTSIRPTYDHAVSAFDRSIQLQFIGIFALGMGLAPFVTPVPFTVLSVVCGMNLFMVDRALRILAMTNLRRHTTKLEANGELENGNEVVRKWQVTIDSEGLERKFDAEGGGGSAGGLRFGEAVEHLLMFHFPDTKGSGEFCQGTAAGEKTPSEEAEKTDSTWSAKIWDAKILAAPDAKEVTTLSSNDQTFKTLKKQFLDAKVVPDSEKVEMLPIDEWDDVASHVQSAGGGGSGQGIKILKMSEVTEEHLEKMKELKKKMSDNSETNFLKKALWSKTPKESIEGSAKIASGFGVGVGLLGSVVYLGYRDPGMI